MLINKLYKYNIHGIVKVVSNILLPERVIPSSFLSRSLDKPDIIVRAGLNPSSPFKVVIRGGVFYVFCPSFHGILGPAASNFIFDVLHIFLIQKGFTFVHAGAVERDGRSFLFVAPPDTGKTFTTLYFTNSANYNYISDDKVITNGKTIYSYPTYITLHSYHLSQVKLNLKSKARLFVKEILGSFPYIHWAIPKFMDVLGVFSEFKISPNTVISRISNKGQLSQIFILDKTNSDNKIIKIDPEKAYRRLKVYSYSDVPPPYSNYQLLKYCPELWDNIDPDLVIMKQNSIFRRMCNENNCFIVKACRSDFFPIIISCFLNKNGEKKL